MSNPSHDNFETFILFFIFFYSEAGLDVYLLYLKRQLIERPEFLEAGTALNSPGFSVRYDWDLYSRRRS